MRDDDGHVPIAAFFDVDNTLLHGASLMYLAREARSLGIVRIGDLLPFVWESRRFTKSGENLNVLDVVRDRGMSLLSGQSAESLHQLAAQVVVRMQKRFWPETRALLTAHIETGHQVWLLSATPDFLADEIARRLGATGGLGSPLEISDGIFTGRFTGPTMHASEKRNAAERIMTEQGMDPRDCYAYSDSINDLPLLTAVGMPTAVNPDQQLAAHARTAGWPMLRLRPASIRAERKRIRTGSRAR